MGRQYHEVAEDPSAEWVETSNNRGLCTKKPLQGIVVAGPNFILIHNDDYSEAVRLSSRKCLLSCISLLDPFYNLCTFLLHCPYSCQSCHSLGTVCFNALTQGSSQNKTRVRPLQETAHQGRQSPVALFSTTLSCLSIREQHASTRHLSRGYSGRGFVECLPCRIMPKTWLTPRSDSVMNNSQAAITAIRNQSCAVFL